MNLDKIRRVVLHKFLIPPLRMVFHLVARKSRLEFSKSSEWSIGIYKGPSPFELRDPPEIRNPVLTAVHVNDVKAEFVADPFMIRHEGMWYMYFEVLNSLRNIGEIGMASSPDGERWSYQRIVLSEPFHLSYPFVFFWEGAYYMIPETGTANQLRLYRAKNFPGDWEFVTALLEGEFADHSLFVYQNTWWLLAGDDPLQHNRLRLYYADSLMGPWREHQKSPIIGDDARIARLAGRAQMVNQELIRFAQDCSPTYGRAVNAFVIAVLSKTDYQERQLGTNPILAPGKTGWTMHGMHHVDAHELKPGEWIACVDGYRRKFGMELPY